ncbi:hypothetical protein S83_047538, partial [Arachis hypogaea]
RHCHRDSASSAAATTVTHIERLSEPFFLHLPSPTTELPSCSSHLGLRLWARFQAFSPLSAHSLALSQESQSSLILSRHSLTHSLVLPASESSSSYQSSSKSSCLHQMMVAARCDSQCAGAAPFFFATTNHAKVSPATTRSPCEAQSATTSARPPLPLFSNS